MPPIDAPPRPRRVTLRPVRPSGTRATGSKAIRPLPPVVDATITVSYRPVPRPLARILNAGSPRAPDLRQNRRRRDPRGRRRGWLASGRGAPRRRSPDDGGPPGGWPRHAHRPRGGRGVGDEHLLLVAGVAGCPDRGPRPRGDGPPRPAPAP